MDGSILWRSALIQAAGVTGLSLLLGLMLPHSFFEDWGWLAGPAAWMACAAATAVALRLPVARVLAGAALAGVLSAAAVVAGLHWLGVVVAIGAFAAWCGWAAARGGRMAWT